MPKHLVGSVYTDYSSGGATQVAYGTLDLTPCVKSN